MRHLTTRLLVLLICLFPAALAQAGEGRSAEEMLKQGFKMYGIERGIIEFELKGSHSGTEWLYFDNWGLREGKFTESVMDVMGIKQKTHQEAYRNGDQVTNVDRTTGRSAIMGVPMLVDMDANSPHKDMSKSSDQFMKMMNAELIGEDEVAGFPVLVYEIKAANTKIYVWKNVGIALKTTVNMMGMEMITVAKSVQRNPDVPEEKLTPPKDLEPTAMPDVHNLMEGLKNLDPEEMKKLGEKFKQGSGGGE